MEVGIFKIYAKFRHKRKKIMKKLILKAMLLCMISNLCVVTALAEWKIDSANGKITGTPDSYSSELVIPESINGITIKSVLLTGGHENDGRELVTSIIFPDSIEEISGFSSFTNLTTIQYPENLISLNAFVYCDSLTEVVVPNGLKNAYGSFAYCENLSSVTLPDGLESLNSYAFQGCTSLTSIKIPDSVTDMTGRPFNESGLVELILPPDLNEAESFLSMPNLTTIIYPDNYQGDVELGAGLPNLTSVYIPGGVSSAVVDEGTARIEYKEKGASLVIESYDNTPGHYLAVDNGFTYVSLGEWIEPAPYVPEASTPSTSTPSTPSTSTPSIESSPSTAEESDSMITLAIIGGVTLVLCVGVVVIFMKKK